MLDRAQTLHELGRSLVAHAASIREAAATAPTAAAMASETASKSSANADELIATAKKYIKVAIETYKKEAAAEAATGHAPAPTPAPASALAPVSTPERLTLPSVKLAYERMAEAWMDMAAIFRTDCKPKEEEVYLKQVLVTIRDSGVGMETVEFAQCMATLARCYRTVKDAKREQDALARCWQIQGKDRGRCTRGAAMTLFGLAMLAAKQANTPSAMHQLKHALAIAEDCIDHAMAARCLKSLADLHAGAAGQVGHRKCLLEHALSLQVACHGKEHRAVIFTVASLANVYGDENNPKRKQAMLVKVAKSLRSILGTDHPEVARALSNLGTAMVSCGDVATGKRFLVQACVMKARVFGENSHDLIKTKVCLANAEALLGNYGEAVCLYKGVLELLENNCSTEQPDKVAALANLARVQLTCGDPSGAVASFTECVAAKELMLDDSTHTELCGPLVGLADALEAVGRNADSVTTLQRVLTIKELEFGKESVEVAEPLIALGSACAGTDWISSCALLKRAVELIDGHGGAHTATSTGGMLLLPTALTKLAWSYVVTGHQTLGIAAMQRAADMLSDGAHASDPAAALEVCENLAKMKLVLNQDNEIFDDDEEYDSTSDYDDAGIVPATPQHGMSMMLMPKNSGSLSTPPHQVRGGFGDLKRMAEGSRLSIFEDNVEEPNSSARTPEVALRAKTSACIQVPSPLRHMPSPLARSGRASLVGVQRSQSSILDHRIAAARLAVPAYTHSSGVDCNAAGAGVTLVRREKSQQILRGIEREGSKLAIPALNAAADTLKLPMETAAAPIPAAAAATSATPPAQQTYHCIRRAPSQQILRRDSSRAMPVVRRAASQQIKQAFRRSPSPRRVLKSNPLPVGEENRHPVLSGTHV